MLRIRVYNFSLGFPSSSLALEESVEVATIHSGNLDRILLTVAAEQETVSVGDLVGAALAHFSDSYTRTRLRELRARGLLEQDESGGPIRISTAGREALARLDGRQESEAAA